MVGALQPWVVHAARVWATLTAAAYLLVLALVVALLVDEGDLHVINGVLVAGAAMGPVFMLVGTRVRLAEARRFRVTGWVMMVVALVPLISFSFMLLLPVAVSAVALLRWDERGWGRAPSAFH